MSEPIDVGGAVAVLTACLSDDPAVRDAAIEDLEQDSGVAIDQLIILAFFLLKNLALERKQRPDEVLQEAAMKLLRGE